MPGESEAHDKLPADQKIQRLKNALSLSKQCEWCATSHVDQCERMLTNSLADLREALWSRSPGADIWVKRRTNFARTIGVGSKCQINDLVREMLRGRLRGPYHRSRRPTRQQHPR